MEIITQGIISSPEDIGKLRIIDFARCNGYWENNPVRAMRVTATWLIRKDGLYSDRCANDGIPTPR